MGLIQNPTTPDELCTLKTCSLAQAHFQYINNLPGNAFYLSVFGLLLLFQFGLGIRYRTWGFLGGMFGGLALEVIGYAGRIQMHFNPFTQNPFLIYLICLTIGPAFLSASIYLCLARLIVVYGPHISHLKPRTYTFLFISGDFLALCLQGAGGGIASTANTQKTGQAGINIMIAGLATQVASLAAFLGLCAEFGWRVWKRRGEMEPAFAGLRGSWRFKAFQISLGVATICIFTRSVFRVAELSAGFHGKLANSQVTFMVLEGAIVVIACVGLTVWHPGPCFQGHWDGANFTLGGGKGGGERSG